MSNYTPIAETFITVDEVEGLRKIIRELKAQLAETVARMRQLEVWVGVQPASSLTYLETLEADNARMHTLADAWAGVTAELARTRARIVELERQLAEAMKERDEWRTRAQIAEGEWREWQAHAGRLAEALNQSKDELWRMRRHYDSHQNMYGDYSVEPDGEVLAMIDAALASGDAESLALWRLQETFIAAYDAWYGNEDHDDGLFNAMERARAAVEAAKGGER
jgi:DNA repair exonuclease SbcCD ATPase subunit